MQSRCNIKSLLSFAWNTVSTAGRMSYRRYPNAAMAMAYKPERLDEINNQELSDLGHGPLSKMKAGDHEPTATSRAARLVITNREEHMRAKLHQQQLKLNLSGTRHTFNPAGLKDKKPK
ncbi:hypothetical protein KR018_001722 [Drosophila ironensis]|nr:hypothetical protein KR018_001722 [Drosophila ironensis]